MSSAGPAHRVQSAVVEYGFPNGHLGHLSLDEEEAFLNFKALCADKGYYKPGNGADEIQSHDDATMLRFLRARRFVPADAYKQFKDTEDWRKATELDKVYETIDVVHYEESRKLYPMWTGRRDRRGIPIYVYEVKHLNAKTMAAYEKSAINTETQAKSDGKTSPKLIRLFALYENLTRFVMPLCTALTDREYPATPITQTTNIVDISGVGLKQFWNLRGHMQDASTLATAHYPETLERIFIIGAPAFFPTVWSWIKKWFDPITTSKIFIVSSHEVKKTLETFIDPQNIPKKYGGQLDFEYGSLPIVDDAVKDRTSWEAGNTGFPIGPLYWVPKDDGQAMEAIAVGSIEQRQRRSAICLFKKPLLNEEESSGINENTITGEGLGKRDTVPEFVNAPTAPPSVAETANTTESSPNTSASSSAPQDSNLPQRQIKKEAVAAESSPLVTNLSLNEKVVHLQSGMNTATTDIPSKLDPAVN